MWLLTAGIVAVSYLLGSFPAGFLAGRFSGIDVRQHGSGNIGATNVLRVLGKKWGYAVFFADALKGFLAVRFASWCVARTPDAADYAEFYAILAAATCVAGHSFPVWLKFRGGKGVATSAGALLGIIPVAIILVFFLWVVVFLATRYVSLASIVAAIALPAVVAVMAQLRYTRGWVLFYFCLAMAGLVVWRHRSNISRLLNGTEQRFARK